MLNTVNSSEKVKLMAEDASRVEGQSAGFMEPGTAVKRGRGRPKKEPAQAGVPSGQEANGQVAPQAFEVQVKELRPLTDSVSAFYSSFLVQYAEDERAALKKDTQDLLSHSMASATVQLFPGQQLGLVATLATIVIIGTQGFLTASHFRRENLAKLRAERQQATQVTPVN